MNLYPLSKVEDCRKYITSVGLLEDYFNLKCQINLIVRGLILLIIRIIALIFTYIPPIILTQLEDSLNKYILITIAISFEYYITTYANQLNRELLMLINSHYSQYIFLQCLKYQSQTTFSGILRELNQIEKAIGSLYQLILIIIELYLAYKLLQIDVVLQSIGYGMLISLLALLAASIAQIYAWRLKYFSDQRLRLTQEILSGIKSIKYLQWEQVFLNIVGKVRNQEFQGNQGIQYVDTVINFFRRMTQVVLLFVVFYKLQHLEPNQFYTLLLFFDRLVIPINAFPWCLGEFLGSFFSIIRLKDFFHQKHNLITFQNNTLTISSHKKDRLFDKVLSIIQGSSNKFIIQFSLQLNISSIPESKLTCIVGQVGSGKSLLLNYLCNGAYVPQQPWLFSGTVRQNILFGSIYDEIRYKETLIGAVIDFDDNKQVGLNGTNLSGGQRTRVAFARALYHECKGYYFDDIFSSVDENVADQMFKTLLRYKNKGKTILLVVNQQQYIQYADFIIQIKSNVVTLQESQSNQIKFEFKQIKQQQIEEEQKEYNEIIPQKEIDVESEQNLIENYKFYINSLGIFSLITFLFFSLIQQAAKGGFELYIYQNVGQLETFDKNQLIYFFIILAILTLIRGFTYSYATIISARHIYQQLMYKFIHLPTFYYDNFSPTFFIRRLFDDMGTIDDLPLNFFFSIVLDALGFFVLVASVQFEIIIYAIIASIILINFMKTYRQFKIEYQQSIHNLYPSQEFDSFVIEIEKGTKTINAFKQEQFVHKKFKQILLHKHALNLSQEQVAIVKGFRNFIVQTIALLLLIFSGDQFISYSYAYLFFGRQYLSSSIDSWSRILQLNQSLERIRQIIGFEQEIKKESLQLIDDQIKFENVWLSYGMAKGMAKAEYALKGISFCIKKGQKVAFCGRTGSGKSSLFNLLVRLYEYQQGNITFLGHSIKDYCHQQLRSMMSVIPQHGLIMNGSIRDNIDPERKYKDEQIKYILNEMQIDLDLNKNSNNLSMGEKQIINFIQSIILQRDIILMDEATSNMDIITNNKIMNCLFNHINNKTLLLISHRLENLEYFDIIYVIDNGIVIEYGTYQQLINKQNSKFNQLKTKL